MKKQVIIFLAGIVAMIGACTYSESGIYHVDPVPGEVPIISVSTNLDTIDNVIVTDSLEVAYNVEIENGDFYLVEAYLANQLAYYSDTTHGAFWISWELVGEPGIDTLSFYFLYSTNSNSLAEIVGVEYNLIQLDYEINFDPGGER